MDNKIVITEDGSHTIYVPLLEEHYHSMHGAINESMHVYINSGLKCLSKNEINLFEVGFGTGLNAFLTLAIATSERIKVNYFSIEKYPLEENAFSLLNYPEQIFSNFSSYFETLHKIEWNVPIQLNSFFTIQKIKGDLKDFNYQNLPYLDLIYFDAFAPGKQPDMWTEDIFKSLYNHTNPNGIFVTYCSKGSVRRTLEALGFSMVRLPGPRGKAEILRGIKH